MVDLMRYEKFDAATANATKQCTTHFNMNNGHSFLLLILIGQSYKIMCDGYSTIVHTWHTRMGSFTTDTHICMHTETNIPCRSIFKKCKRPGIRASRNKWTAAHISRCSISGPQSWIYTFVLNGSTRIFFPVHQISFSLSL